MISIEAVDQTYFINIDEYYNIQSSIYDDNKGIGKLIFEECIVMNEQWESVDLDGLKEFYSVAEWRKFKSALTNRIEEVETYVMLFLKRIKDALSGGSEDDAKSYWNDSDEDSYPRSDFDTFDDWYGSNDYYEWDADNIRIQLDDFRKENESIFEALDSEDYMDSYDNVYTRTISRAFDQIRSTANRYMLEVDNDIKNKMSENSHEAVQYIFEY